MKKKITLRILFAALIMAMVMAFGSSAATAASETRTGWYVSKSKKVYYYDQSGKMLKNGRKKINGKYYYFTKSGVQLTGWQKIGKYYYYFNIASGKKGYMVTSKKVNGITLQKNGRAKITSYSKQKLPILFKANVIMRTITKTSDTKAQKLKKCFEYTKTYMQYRSTGAFYSKSNWDIYYATRFFVSGDRTGSCFSYGVVFAYLANAVGYKVSAVSSGGHGWAEIGNYVYDPDWAMADKAHNYCGMKYGTKGKNIPNYASNRAYVITI